MLAVRRLLAQRCLAALICAAALLLRLMVPAGYMIGADGGRVTIELCPGVAGGTAQMAMPGMGGDMPGHGKKDHGRAETPCPFAGLSAPALGGADPLLLVALALFIIAVGLRSPASPRPPRRTYVRPPLRGPPIRL